MIKNSILLNNKGCIGKIYKNDLKMDKKIKSKYLEYHQGKKLKMIFGLGQKINY